MTQEKSLKEEETGSDMIKPILENEKIRVLKAQIKPGETTPMHSHPDHIICSLKDQKFKVHTSEGEGQEVELNFGDVLYFGPVTHAVENTGKTDAIALVIELK
jgi:quercetin dioxygenase-like cupin family protein